MKKFITSLAAIAMLTSTVGAVPSSAYSVEIEEKADHSEIYEPGITVLSRAKVAKVKVKSAYSSGTSAVKIKWNEVKGASGYRVYRYNGKKYVKIANTKKTSFKDTKLKAGTRYKYKVKAFKRTSKGTVWGKASSPKKTATKPSTVKLSSFAAAQDSITLKWKKQTCDGYQIYQKKNGKYVKITTVKSAKKTSYKVTGLDAGTKYYFKVRAFTRDGAGKNLFSSFKGKAKTTPTIYWSPLMKAYYKFCTASKDFTDEDFELIRKDMVEGAIENCNGKTEFYGIKLDKPWRWVENPKVNSWEKNAHLNCSFCNYTSGASKLITEVLCPDSEEDRLTDKERYEIVEEVRDNARKFSEDGILTWNQIWDGEFPEVYTGEYGSYFNFCLEKYPNDSGFLDRWEIWLLTEDAGIYDPDGEYDMIIE